MGQGKDRTAVRLSGTLAQLGGLSRLASSGPAAEETVGVGVSVGGIQDITGSYRSSPVEVYTTMSGNIGIVNVLISI